MKEYFKDLPDGSDFFNVPRGDDSLTVEARDMMRYFGDIKDYIKALKVNKFEGRSSSELHATAEALSDLWMRAHSMSDAIAKLQYEMENLAYSREDEEAYEAEEEGAYQEHVGYMNSWYSGSRV